MNIFKKTLSYKIYDTFITLYYYIKTVFTIKSVFYTQEFISLLNTYLNTNIKKDWIGRLYGVVNPNIDKNGNFSINNTILEIDDENTNSDEYVKNWLYKQLYTVGSLFKLKNIYSYITLDIDHVGPLNQDNYLIVFDIAARKIFADSFKSALKHLVLYTIIIILIYTLYKFI